MKIIITSLVLLISLITYSQTGKELMMKYDDEMHVDDQTVDLTMQLINVKGKVRERKLEWMIQQSNENNNIFSFIRFQSPADIKGTGFLLIEHQDIDDDQWLYLPALKRSRRISSSEQSDNFMGSDFTYEDIGDEDIEKYDYKLLKNELLNDNEVFVIEALPNNDNTKKESGYSKRIIYLQKENNLIRKIEYFNQNDQLSKILLINSVNCIVEARKWRAHKYEMKNILKGSSTILIFNNYKINEGIDENIFTKRYLENW